MQLLGDLLIRQFLDVPQQHRRPQRRRQLVERLPQQRPPVALLERGVEPDFRRHGGEVAGVDVPIDGFPLLADAAVVVDTEVPADADQPRLEVRPPIEGVERLEQLQEDVLGQVLGFVVLAHELYATLNTFRQY